MKRSHLLIAMSVAMNLLLAPQSDSHAQCKPGYTLKEAFGQLFGGNNMWCVVKITYCVNNADTTKMEILSHEFVGPPCSVDDPCEALRQTLAIWQFGACWVPGQPPKPVATHTVTYCGSTCTCQLFCLNLEYPLVGKIGCN